MEEIPRFGSAIGGGPRWPDVGSAGLVLKWEHSKPRLPKTLQLKTVRGIQGQPWTSMEIGGHPWMSMEIHVLHG